LILAAKARAALHGRLHAGIGDLRAVAPPVLRHRIVTTFHAEAEGITSDSIVAHLLETVLPPTETASNRLGREFR
jgi:MoxR-like ATPase